MNATQAREHVWLSSAAPNYDGPVEPLKAELNDLQQSCSTTNERMVKDDIQTTRKRQEHTRSMVEDAGRVAPPENTRTETVVTQVMSEKPAPSQQSASLNGSILYKSIASVGITSPNDTSLRDRSPLTQADDDGSQTFAISAPIGNSVANTDREAPARSGSMDRGRAGTVAQPLRRRSISARPTDTAEPPTWTPEENDGTDVRTLDPEHMTLQPWTQP